MSSPPAPPSAVQYCVSAESSSAAPAASPPPPDACPPPPLLRRSQATGRGPPPVSVTPDTSIRMTLDAFPMAESEAGDPAQHLFQIRVGENMPAPFDEVNWVVQVDRSGSMADRCKDGKTKADHVRHTIQNMCACLNSRAGGAGTQHTMDLHSFDDRAEVVFENKPVGELQGESLAACLGPQSGMSARGQGPLAPRGMTDVGQALDRSARSVETRARGPASGRSCRVAHVFLTDGHVTRGATRHDLLRAKVPTGPPGVVRNAFIGYGHEHCAHLLQNLARDDPGPRTGRTYHFADSLEHAGMVFGDVLHGVTHEQAHAIHVTVTGGSIYDADARTWGCELEVEPMASGDARSWVIRADGAGEPQVTVRYMASGLGPRAEAQTEQPASSDAALPPDQFAYANRRQECIEAMADARACLDGANPPTAKAAPELDAADAQVAHAVLDMAKAGQWDMVRAMVESASIEKTLLVNACPRPRRFALLHHAVQQGSLDDARYLVAAGAKAAATRDGASLVELVPRGPAGELRSFVEGLGTPAQHQGPPARAAVLARLDALLKVLARAREALDAESDLAKQYKELADDIYITRLSMTAIDASVAAMYMGARAGSAGRQGGYAVGDLDALTRGQTQEGTVFRSNTAAYRVKAPGARVGASWGATEAMYRCMGARRPTGSSGSDDDEDEAGQGGR